MVSIRGSAISVFLLDVGSTVSTSTHALHTIDAAIARLPPQARLCVLAGVEVPPAGKWADESKACLEDLTDRDHFKASVVLRDTLNRLAVFLYREGDEDVTVNERMLSEGWGRLEGNAYARFKGSEEILNSMKEYQEDAKEDRVGVFQYGDIGFDNDK